MNVLCNNLQNNHLRRQLKDLHQVLRTRTEVAITIHPSKMQSAEIIILLRASTIFVSRPAHTISYYLQTSCAYLWASVSSFLVGTRDRCRGLEPITPCFQGERFYI